jgi:hypothetical protein
MLGGSLCELDDGLLLARRDRILRHRCTLLDRRTSICLRGTSPLRTVLVENGILKPIAMNSKTPFSTVLSLSKNKLK